ncbi:P-loop containing nucleoside triphosphate hydrolase protein [Amanita muscaria]
MMNTTTTNMNAKRDENDIQEQELTLRSSVYTTTSSIDSISKPPVVHIISTFPSLPPPKPSIRLLFSLLSSQHLLLLLPAILSSIIAGGVAPFMTYVVGQAFDAFARFPTDPSSSHQQEARNQLLHGVGIAALELVALAVGSLVMSSVTSFLWIWIGETNAMEVRKKVYSSVMARDMVWFDTRMGNDGIEIQDTPIGAGGLMAKFARETDDVRMASSLSSGMLIQYLTTTITCLMLGFTRSWALTLVILSAVPILTFIQGFSQSIAGPLLSSERSQTGSAATLIDRAIASISTVKAFNAGPHELSSTSHILSSLDKLGKRLSLVWATTSGLSQFVMMSMFVQGFWFGSKLVREHKILPGDVMAVFWACLIATSNLQMCIPQFITLAKGKHAMAELLTLVETDNDGAAGAMNDGAPFPLSPSAPIPSTQTKSFYSGLPSKRTSSSGRSSQLFRKITPRKCVGEIALDSVTFAYPSRPSTTVLSDASIFLPANETTFIVGSSGSGKSTIAALLSRMYHLHGEGCSGIVHLDDQDVRYIDEAWMKTHIACVRQGECVIIDGTIWDNVVLGLEEGGRGKPTKEEVEEACRAAMVHDFVKDLPDGYETRLGSGGVGLSGGQKQRLALARARLWNPTVLILDEATSALDATSRLLVFEALKRWRANKTTIVITHDLSQIEPTDFTYVLKQGRVVEQGYRGDLEKPASEEARQESEFCAMLEAQMKTGGYLPEKDEGAGIEEQCHRPQQLLEHLLEEMAVETEDPDHESVEVPFTFQHDWAKKSRRTTMANWMLDVVADLTSASAPSTSPLPSGAGAIPDRRASRFVPFEAFTAKMEEDRDLEMSSALASGYGNRRKGQGLKRPKSITISNNLAMPAIPSPVKTAMSRRLSLQFTPTSAVFPVGQSIPWQSQEQDDGISSATRLIYDDEEFEDDKDAVERTAGSSHAKRLGLDQRQRTPRTRWDDTKVVAFDSVHIDSKSAPSPHVSSSNEERLGRPQFWKLLLSVYPTIPYKPLFFFGLGVCLLSGAMTPLFSFLLSRLLFEVSTGAHNASLINKFGAIVLSVAALDGILMGTKYFIMEFEGMTWETKIRKRAFAKVLAQDRKFFDKENNSPARIVQVLVKDGDDARNLVAVVIGQCLVVSAMLGVGLLWALARGWQLTLAGVAIAPVFAGVMALQTGLVAKCEVRNKRAREDVAQSYYEAILNVRAIRSMSIEAAFKARFNKAADQALLTGVKGALVEGCTYGVASGLIYLAEAILFYVGAVLIASGTYTYLQMVEVLNLVVFSVTIGSQLMAFTQKIAKSVHAASDLDKLLKLSTHTDESRGVLRPSVSGPVHFSNVEFSYSERPEAQVLKGVNLHVAPGECVAIVGPSGSGKSTIASLLQRLYEPLSGVITIGGIPLHMINVEHLRNHVSVVSQNPNLFDASIAENIRYGNKTISDADVKRAAQAAHVHEFIMSLPQGYDTLVGENAALISGGQAQRIQIARALARPASILILDECTSALDPANQAAVLETIKDAKVGRTTIMVTHKLQIMKMCDRIVLVDGGEVTEEGTYEALMERRGHFAKLTGGGEWTGD